MECRNEASATVRLGYLEFLEHVLRVSVCTACLCLFNAAVPKANNLAGLTDLTGLTGFLGFLRLSWNREERCESCEINNSILVVVILQLEHIHIPYCSNKISMIFEWKSSASVSPTEIPNCLFEFHEVRSQLRHEILKQSGHKQNREEIRPTVPNALSTKFLETR